MNIKIIFNKISYALILISSLLASTASYSHGGGSHSHEGGISHGHGHVENNNYHGRTEYHRHGGYYRGYGGYWGGGWYGPNVIIGVPFGGYYAYPTPVCEMTRRCYPNGECVETEICG